jgi:cytoskeletal protein CcmA (bactofilin family)
MGFNRQEITVISENSSVEGELKASEAVIILGSFKGRIDSKTLEINPDGKVIASVEAVNITISGYFEGELVCHALLRIYKTATVKGKVAYGTLSVEPGSRIEAEVFQFESMDTKLVPFYTPKVQSENK